MKTKPEELDIGDVILVRDGYSGFNKVVIVMKDAAGIPYYKRYDDFCRVGDRDEWSYVGKKVSFINWVKNILK